MMHYTHRIYYGIGINELHDHMAPPSGPCGKASHAYWTNTLNNEIFIPQLFIILQSFSCILPNQLTIETSKREVRGNISVGPSMTDRLTRIYAQQHVNSAFLDA